MGKSSVLKIRFNAEGDGKSGERRLFNLRPFFFCFAFLCMGIYLSGRVFAHGDSVLLSLFSLSALPLFYFAGGRKRNCLVLAFVCIIVFFIGFILFSLLFERFCDSPLSGYVGAVECKIISKSFYGDGFIYVADGITAGGNSYGGRISFTYDTELYVGARVLLGGELSCYGRDYAFALGSTALIRDIRYSIELNSLGVLSLSYSPLAAFRDRLWAVLSDNLGGQSAAVCYALITGDTSAMDGALLSSVRYGGIAHLFAVSGLHITIVSVAVKGILAKFGAGRAVSSAASFIITLIYAAFCGFTPSSVRAFFTVTASDFGFYFYSNGDRLENIGFAGIGVLALNPAHLFSVGFSLSFLAVIGMGLYSSQMKRFFRDKREPKSSFKNRIRSSFVDSAAVNLFILPVLTDSFFYASAWGLLLNLILIPAMSLFFAPMLALSILSACIPAIAPVALFLPKVFFDGAVLILRSVDFSSSVISGIYFGAAKYTYYAFLISLSNKINLSSGERTATAFALFALTCVILLVVNLS